MMNQPVNDHSEEVLKLQKDLIVEEFNEFIESHQDTTEAWESSQEETLKELADLVFVCFQYAAAAGWELDCALNAVYRSNLSKLVDGKPVKDSNGKVTKGPNYTPPELGEFI